LKMEVAIRKEKMDLCYSNRPRQMFTYKLFVMQSISSEIIFSIEPSRETSTVRDLASPTY